MVYRHNSYITKKIPYIKISIRIRIVELSKQPLFMVYGGEKNQILANASN